MKNIVIEQLEAVLEGTLSVREIDEMLKKQQWETNAFHYFYVNRLVFSRIALKIILNLTLISWQ